MAYRWFLGLELYDPVPHFSTFGKNYTRRFKDTDLFEQIFQHILEECYRFKLVDSTEIFVDATHVKARANNKKMQRRIAQQGLITTHSNEMVRVAGISHLRVIRRKGSFISELYDPSKLIKGLKESNNENDKLLADFYDWFFEIGYSERVFADKAIFYEGDTERLYIRELLTLEKYKKLRQQYIAYIQVGGAYAKNYQKMIELLGIKSLIITDIDYAKESETVDDILKSEITNATLKEFYRIDNPGSNPTVNDLYAWKDAKKNVISNALIYTCFQTNNDGYARTLEEAMLSQYFSINITTSFTKKEWVEKRNDSKLEFVIPTKGIKDDDPIKLRGILKSSSGSKTSFMYSVVLNKKAEISEPNYIQGGLKWLME